MRPNLSGKLSASLAFILLFLLFFVLHLNFASAQKLTSLNSGVVNQPCLVEFFNAATCPVVINSNFVTPNLTFSPSIKNYFSQKITFCRINLDDHYKVFSVPLNIGASPPTWIEAFRTEYIPFLHSHLKNVKGFNWAIHPGFFNTWLSLSKNLIALPVTVTAFTFFLGLKNLRSVLARCRDPIISLARSTAYFCAWPINELVEWVWYGDSSWTKYPNPSIYGGTGPGRPGGPGRYGRQRPKREGY